MIVLVLSACPTGLRGYLTRWLLEISAGVFVGHLPRRVRDLVWAETIKSVGRGRAIMVHSARNEQRLDFRVHGHHWEPVDFEGISLMLRPRADGEQSASADENTGTKSSASRAQRGWSNASKHRRYGRGR